MALTDSQKYLLNRLPRLYDLRATKDDTEPAEITRARKLIEAFETKQSNKRKAAQKKLEKMLNAAREAIHFKPAEKALEIVKALEAEIEAQP